jgi:hypothetical protein
MTRYYAQLTSAMTCAAARLRRLVMMCLDNAGSVSKNRRKQFAHLVPETIFDVIEAEAKAVLSEENESKDEPGETPDHT